MKATGVALALAIVGVLLYWFVLRTASTPAPAVQSVAGSGSSTAQTAQTAQTARAVDKVRRVTKAERNALAQQIEAANAERKRRAEAVEGRVAPGEKEALPTLEQDDEIIVKTTMRDAMRQLIPMIADCYNKGGSALQPTMDVVANLTLTGDPDIGTIVDANGFTNKDGSPVNEAFGACVQDTLVTLEMPPISEGNEVKVTYPFAFARDDSTMPP